MYASVGKQNATGDRALLARTFSSSIWIHTRLCRFFRTETDTMDTLKRSDSKIRKSVAVSVEMLTVFAWRATPFAWRTTRNNRCS